MGQEPEAHPRRLAECTGKCPRTTSAAGVPDDSTPEGRAQKDRLSAWVNLVEREKLMEYVTASYEVVPLLAEYSPRINAQQLKNALISRKRESG